MYYAEGVPNGKVYLKLRLHKRYSYAKIYIDGSLMQSAVGTFTGQECKPNKFDDWESGDFRFSVGNGSHTMDFILTDDDGNHDTDVPTVRFNINGGFDCVYVDDAISQLGECNPDNFFGRNTGYTSDENVPAPTPNPAVAPASAVSDAVPQPQSVPKSSSAEPQSQTGYATSVTNDDAESLFDGNSLQFFGLSLLARFLTVITLGITLPWTKCMLVRWKVKHTVISGRRMTFDGTGAGLFGNYILWWLLSIITFGIYSLWTAVNLIKWEVKHTHAVGYEGIESSFDGSVVGYFGYRILTGFISLITCGIGIPWAVVMILGWEKKHTVLSGERLSYNGTGAQHLGRYLLWFLLSAVTAGIYGLFVPVSNEKFVVKHTHSASASVCYVPAQNRPVPQKKINTVLIIIAVLAALLIIGAIFALFFNQLIFGTNYSLFSHGNGSTVDTGGKDGTGFYISGDDGTKKTETSGDKSYEVSSYTEGTDEYDSNEDVSAGGDSDEHSSDVGGGLGLTVEEIAARLNGCWLSRSNDSFMCFEFCEFSMVKLKHYNCQKVPDAGSEPQNVIYYDDDFLYICGGSGRDGDYELSVSDSTISIKMIFHPDVQYAEQTVINYELRFMPDNIDAFLLIASDGTEIRMIRGDIESYRLG